MKTREFRIALKNAGRIDPTSIEAYEAAGGFKALARALEMLPDQIIAELTASNLRGRGGAGFPTGAKNRFASESLCRFCGPKYIVCNADEGEPGTFKDRIIMEQDPHLLIEGMIIAAYAIGATRGYIYIRGEYHPSIRRIRQAIEASYRKGYLGDSVLGSGHALDLEVKLGAGSYLCGEELTLLESLEGKRGYPRIKPPYPAQKGLWNAPTLINNVETFAHIPYIVEKGAAHYKTIGCASAPGTKIFTVSGDVNRPGHYETEMGVTLRELIDGFALGVARGKAFKAALVGGAAGAFVDETVLDTPLTYDDMQARGAVLGSGAVIVLDEDRSFCDMTASILRFFRHESCGKCVPCRIGTNLLVEMIESVRQDKAGRRQMLAQMVAEARYMAGTSLCPLGQSPILPLGSLMRYFQDHF